jgi:hypothetical protein
MQQVALNMKLLPYLKRFFCFVFPMLYTLIAMRLIEEYSGQYIAQINIGEMIAITLLVTLIAVFIVAFIRETPQKRTANSCAMFVCIGTFISICFAILFPVISRHSITAYFDQTLLSLKVLFQ